MEQCSSLQIIPFGWGMFDKILELSHDARVLISTETWMKLNPKVPLKDETMNSSTVF